MPGPQSLTASAKHANETLRRQRTFAWTRAHRTSPLLAGRGSARGLRGRHEAASELAHASHPAEIPHLLSAPAAWTPLASATVDADGGLRVVCGPLPAASSQVASFPIKLLTGEMHSAAVVHMQRTFGVDAEVSLTGRAPRFLPQSLACRWVFLLANRPGNRGDPALVPGWPFRGLIELRSTDPRL